MTTILVPGAKKRVLAKLAKMKEMVEQNEERDTIAWLYHGLGVEISNGFSYMEQK